MTQLFNLKELKARRRELRNSLTNAEKILWKHLKQRQIEDQRFLRQFSIDRFIVDFYCPKLKLIIEVDGDSHFQDNNNYDNQRQKYLESLGLNVLRFTNNDIYQSLDHVIKIITDKVIELKKS
jgi:very-short-patch-repair endonuclease